MPRLYSHSFDPAINCLKDESLLDALERERREKDARINNLENQINKLSAFIIENVPGEPSQSQGAVDTAIRLLSAPNKDRENDDARKNHEDDRREVPEHMGRESESAQNDKSESAPTNEFVASCQARLETENKAEKPVTRKWKPPNNSYRPKTK